MACFPMLLVITAEFDSWTSTKAFKVQGCFCWLELKQVVNHADVFVFLSRFGAGGRDEVQEAPKRVPLNPKL